jgi:hypothetical protein
MFDATDPSPQYELDWPRELFVAEATGLLADLSNPRWLEDAELLLEEAFIGSVPKEDLRTAKWHNLPTDVFKNAPAASAAEVARAFVTHVVNSADKLPEASKRRPYWSAEHAAQGASTQSTAQRRYREALSAGPLQQDWVRLVEDLRDRGYLDCVAPQGCVAKPASTPAAEVLASTLTRSLHADISWPPLSQDWDSDTLYGLIEAVHDLIARPRHRDRHLIVGCRWHYSDFAKTPGQILYRRDVNQLLDRFGAGLRLASEGEDMGRLVRVAGDDRTELVERTLQTPNPGDRDAVRHAVALWRDRAANRDMKRSAVLALHRVLEDRRSLIKAELMSKDEGALFQIANEFDLRHSGARQRTDYEDAYLDWIFWWYLATVELTDRIGASQVDSS